MKKKIFCFFLICSLIMTMFTISAFADATTVVTIGQDLTDEQEAFIIKYFGADLSTSEVIYVNNQQEREYVGSWIPLEQIGNITISSAYVQPTRSGGIQVKTANLTYVTGNMIASVLSTAGVKNCNVVAAAPFPVSGTGALTGVMIAYQKATNTYFEEEKRDLAIQEFVITQQAAESIGENEALQLMNAVKMEVIRSDVDAGNTEQIQQIVTQVINNVEENINVDNSVTNIDNSTTIINNGLTEEEKTLIIDFATEIAKQNYQYEDVKETLERVEENLSEQTNINVVVTNENEINIDNQDEVGISDDNQIGNTSEEENILDNTNDDMEGIAYQNSTRQEDIMIEETFSDEPAEVDVNEEDTFADIVMTEEYYQEDTSEENNENSDDFMPEIEENIVEFGQDVENMPPDISDVSTEDDMPSIEDLNTVVVDEEMIMPPEESENPEELIEESQEELVEEGASELANDVVVVDEEMSNYCIRFFIKDTKNIKNVKVTDKNENIILETDYLDTNHIMQTEMSKELCEKYGFDSGVMVDVFLSEGMREGEEYTLYLMDDEYSKEIAVQNSALHSRFDVTSTKNMCVEKTIQMTVIPDDSFANMNLDLDDTMIEIVNQNFDEENNCFVMDLKLIQSGTSELAVTYFDNDGEELCTEQYLLNICEADDTGDTDASEEIVSDEGE